jgi:HPt (histidine-containing phosphotransfer) domain-containing protein
MTANALPGDRELCLQTGMDDYLGKPIEMNALVNALQQCSPLASEQPPATPLAEQGPAFDPAAIERLRTSLGPQADTMLPELLNSFFIDSETLQVTARQAWQANNAAEVHRIAHSLKSNSLSFGALALARLCERLETQARTGDLAESAVLLDQIADAYQHVRPMLQTLL